MDQPRRVARWRGLATLPHAAALAALALIGLLAVYLAAPAEEKTRVPCTEDAMIVFDASGSMAGNTVQGLFSDITRIDEVRKALAQVLRRRPNIARSGSSLTAPDLTCNAMSSSTSAPYRTPPSRS